MIRPRYHHLIDVFALAPAAPLRLREMLVAFLGVAGPILVGTLLGQVLAGLTIGLGAVLLSGARAGESSAALPTQPRSAAVPALLAVAAATVVAGHAWTDAVMVLLAMLAALASGYSRPVGVASIRFIIYFVLGLGIIDGAGRGQSAAAFVFGLGALWNIALRILLLRRGPSVEVSAGRTPTAAQRRTHFRRTLLTVAGWQFSLRLAAGLTVATLIRHTWPEHHFQWVVLTVALLTQRPIERLPVKLLQRVIGTVVGVALAWIVLASASAPAAMLVAAGVLGTLAPLARSRSYLLYSMAMTPLILLVLDYGKLTAWASLEDRVSATLIGGAIVVIANVIADRYIGGSKRPSMQQRLPVQIE